MINQINLAIAQYLYIDYELTQQDKGKALVIPNFLTLQTYRMRIKIISIGIYIHTYSNSDPFPSIAFNLLHYSVGYLRDKLDFPGSFRFILGT